ncbi:MAG TPA: hypothetical protein DEA63_00610 [Firmicutes bacterium]|nr:hypothetical protein [Bacillota bacterium]
MRIDKFLKVSRLILRREVAKQLCDDGDVSINGKPAKPSSEVNPDDVLTLRLGRKRITVSVRETRPFASKADAAKLYEIIRDETLTQEDEK